MCDSSFAPLALNSCSKIGMSWSDTMVKSEYAFIALTCPTRVDSHTIKCESHCNHIALAYSDVMHVLLASVYTCAHFLYVDSMYPCTRPSCAFARDNRQHHRRTPMNLCDHVMASCTPLLHDEPPSHALLCTRVVTL